MHKLKVVVGRVRPLVSSLANRNLATTSVTAQSRTAVPSSSLVAEPFLNGTSSSYVEEMYESWLENPTSVHKVSTSINHKLNMKCTLVRSKKIPFLLSTIHSVFISCDLKFLLKPGRTHQIFFFFNFSKNFRHATNN